MGRCLVGVLGQRFAVRRVWVLVVVLGAVENSDSGECFEVVIGNVVLVVVFGRCVAWISVGVVPLVAGIWVVEKMLCWWVGVGILAGC